MFSALFEAFMWGIMICFCSLLFGFILILFFCLACRSLFFLKNNIDPIQTLKKDQIQHTLNDVLSDGEEQRKVESGWT